MATTKTAVKSKSYSKCKMVLTKGGRVYTLSLDELYKKIVNHDPLSNEPINVTDIY